MSRRLAAVSIAALVALLTSCGGNRPSVAEWESAWERVTALIPAEEVTEQSLSDEFCSEILAELRSSRGDLLPTPDLAIDDAVNLWMEIAEDAFFECPPQGDPIGSLGEAYAEMLRLEQEIDLVLRLDGDS